MARLAGATTVTVCRGEHQRDLVRFFALTNVSGSAREGGLAQHLFKKGILVSGARSRNADPEHEATNCAKAGAGAPFRFARPPGQVTEA